MKHTPSAVGGSVLVLSLALLGGCRGDSATMPAEPAATDSNVSAKADSTTQIWGSFDTANATETTVSKVLDESSDMDGERVVLTGKIAELCPKGGCWVQLAPADADHTGTMNDQRTLFVKLTMPYGDDGRVLPTGMEGDIITVQGTVKVTEVDEETRRHYAEDAGQSAEEIEKIVGSEKQIQVMSDGVMVASK